MTVSYSLYYSMKMGKSKYFVNKKIKKFKKICGKRLAFLVKMRYDIMNMYVFEIIGR